MTKADFNYQHAHYIVRIYKRNNCVAIGHFPTLNMCYAFITRDSRLYPGCAYQIKSNI